MEKLELKHLSGYLPYGLKVQTTSTNYKETYILFSLDPFGFGFKEGELFLRRCKPILHPLSDLTKEIEVNGEKFVPRDILDLKFRPSSKDLIIYYFNNQFCIDIDTEDYSQTIDLFDGYLIVTQLLEWHFDIHNLIEKGLAIDINTLNK